MKDKIPEKNGYRSRDYSQNDKKSAYNSRVNSDANRKHVSNDNEKRASREDIELYDGDIKDGYIEGRNAVNEALKAKRPIDKIYIAKGETDATLAKLVSKAKESGVVVVETDRRKLDSMSQTGAHQGIIGIAAVKEYVSLDDILDIAKSRGEDPFIIICDEISDAHNLGAIIRTSEAAGVHGIIIPKRRSAGMSAVVSKTSAGAVEYMAISRVPNISAAIKELKERGIWVYGTTADGDSELWNTDMKGPIALVIGSEGSGMSRLVEENCDFKLSIPMMGNISSLNASASAAIVIYEVLRQRRSF